MKLNEDFDDRNYSGNRDTKKDREIKRAKEWQHHPDTTQIPLSAKDVHLASIDTTRSNEVSAKSAQNDACGRPLKDCQGVPDAEQFVGLGSRVDTGVGGEAVEVVETRERRPRRDCRFS